MACLRAGFTFCPVRTTLRRGDREKIQGKNTQMLVVVVVVVVVVVTQKKVNTFTQHDFADAALTQMLCEPNLLVCQRSNSNSCTAPPRDTRSSWTHQAWRWSDQPWIQKRALSPLVVFLSSRTVVVVVVRDESSRTDPDDDVVDVALGTRRS
jgi:hypothetical protein